MRRNDPCPCGSGKKYKKCCGAERGNVVQFGAERLDGEFFAVAERLMHFAESNYIVFSVIPSDDTPPSTGDESGGRDNIVDLADFENKDDFEDEDENEDEWDEDEDEGGDDADGGFGETADALLLDHKVFDIRSPNGKTIAAEFLRRHLPG